MSENRPLVSQSFSALNGGSRARVNALLGSKHLGQPILVQPHPIEPQRNPGGKASKARGAEMPPSVIALNSPVELSSRPQPFPINSRAT